MLEGRNSAAAFRDLFCLCRACGKYDAGAGIIEDVNEAIVRLIEIDRHVDGAESLNREVRCVPFRTVRRKKPDAIT